MFAMKMTTLSAGALAFALASVPPALAGAQPPPDAPTPAPPTVAPDTSTPPVTEAPPVVKPTPPPYSLPWQLRPAAAANVVRSDTSSGMRSDGGNGGTTVVTTLLASYKVTPDLAVVIRRGFAHRSPPPHGPPSAFLNPAPGAASGFKLGSGFRPRPFPECAPPAGDGGAQSPAS